MRRMTLGQIGEHLGGDVGHEGGADVAEEALDLAATAWPVGPRVDQRDVERGADDLQVMGAKRRAVVDVYRLWSRPRRTVERLPD